MKAYRQEAFQVKKKTLRRVGALVCSAVIGSAALAMFAGCTTKHPEITITYTFNGKDYKVDYVLSRNDAPKTVQHFIELANAGFYDGMVIHDYQSSALYTGGYYYSETDDDGLVEVDYFTRVRELETEKGIKFTQTVWQDEARTTPTYTVYGEFVSNGAYTEYSRENSYSKGALVMYYTEKGGNDQVWVARADGGKGNNGNPYQEVAYAKNSATSLFYTFTGSSATGTVASDYCVFGKASNYSQLSNGSDGLLDAIADYIEELEGEESFTETVSGYRLNRYEFFEDVRTSDKTADYSFPREQPIIVKSVKVNKY